MSIEFYVNPIDMILDLNNFMAKTDAGGLSKLHIEGNYYFKINLFFERDRFINITIDYSHTNILDDSELFGTVRQLAEYIVKKLNEGMLRICKGYQILDELMSSKNIDRNILSVERKIMNSLQRVNINVIGYFKGERIITRFVDRNYPINIIEPREVITKIKETVYLPKTLCSVCFCENVFSHVFGCGHLACVDCMKNLKKCHMGCKNTSPPIKIFM